MRIHSLHVLGCAFYVLQLHDLGKDYDLDDIACEKVPDYDTRKSLRNGWKVVAQRDFDALEVVGPYKGWVSSLKEYEDAIPLIQRLQFEQHLVSTTSTIDLSGNGEQFFLVCHAKNGWEIFCF